jgi:hypothetical protein
MCVCIHTLFKLFLARTCPDKCYIFNKPCQKSHTCWHIICFRLSDSCLLECIAGWNKLRIYEYSAIGSGSRIACQGFSGDPGTPSLMKHFYFTEILTKQYYAGLRIKVVFSCELSLPLLDYIYRTSWKVVVQKSQRYYWNTFFTNINHNGLCFKMRNSVSLHYAFLCSVSFTVIWY